MNKFIFNLVFAILIVSGSGCTVKNHERFLFIALDGISVEGLQEAKTPNIDKLMNDGAFSLKTRVVMPSITLPNWTSHLTGSGPEQHGVTDNKWLLDDHVLPAVETDSKGYYPSIFKVLRDQAPGIKIGFYYNWENLIYPYNQDYMDEVYYEDNYDYLKSFEKAFNFIKENKDKPTFVFLYSVHTDEAGHKYGWMSPEYITSLEEADLRIGELMDKMEKEGILKNTHILFTSDHGGFNKGHGGVLPVMMEVPWSLTGPGVIKGMEIKEPNNTVNSAYIIAHLFNCKPPIFWTGRVVSSIFKN